MKEDKTRLPPPDSFGKGLIDVSRGASRVGARGTWEAKQLCKMNWLSEAEVPAWCLEPPGRSVSALVWVCNISETPEAEGPRLEGVWPRVLGRGCHRRRRVHENIIKQSYIN
ncbi:hypothetical protein E2C01_014721 [Portunus trituberculatus]|uniref:Uncharacterized protein n=1 Tax=Portunus trituberculatus TaxID=210409 RepID=A0A5B7DKP8_PORTR|nr:hypothetical protein [Portunus trituberculatus]